MPRILEMKAVNEEIWVRIENLSDEQSPVHLWTNEEVQAYRRRIRADMLDEIIEKFR